jgi:hypothetical protein
MGKFLDEEMNEVEAFTKEEVDAQIAKATEAKAAEVKKEFEKTLSEKDSEVSALSEKLTKRGEEYNNAKSRIKELETQSATGLETVTEAKNKFRDGLIDKLSGEDKEYKEAIKAQAERLGFDTLDVNEAEKILKESHTLAQLALNREVTSFNMASVSTAGHEPNTSVNANKDKATDAMVAAVAESMGGGSVAPEGGMVL